MNRTRDAISTEQLFERHAGFVARFLYRLGASAESMDDLVQEVFLAVHRQGGYRPGSTAPTTFLAGLASNLYANQRRDARVRKRFLRRLLSLRGDQAQHETPMQHVEATQTQRALIRALDTLDYDLRSVMVMADLEYLPHAEIATVLSIPVGTVWYRLHEARKRWMHELEKTFAEPARVPRLVTERSHDL